MSRFWGQCVLRHWHGYTIRIHPSLDEMYPFDWDATAALLDTWLGDNPRLPPIDFIEIQRKRVLLVMRDNVGSVVLLYTEEGLKEECELLFIQSQASSS